MNKSNECSALTETVFYILISMYVPIHGYAVMQKIESLSCGRICMGAGTLYGAINALLEKQWIESVIQDDPRKKEYVITDLGKKMIDKEIIRLEELLNHGKEIVGGKNESY